MVVIHLPNVQADMIAISFVRDHNILENVRSYVTSQLQRRHPGHQIDIVAKMEAYDSVAAMPQIIAASDGVMVARSDLGAQIPMEDVPAVQREIVYRCRQARSPTCFPETVLLRHIHRLQLIIHVKVCGGADGAAAPLVLWWAKSSLVGCVRGAMRFSGAPALGGNESDYACAHVGRTFSGGSPQQVP
jgi:hypothetical protein